MKNVVTGQVKGNSLDDFSYRWACERVTIGKGQTVSVKLTHDPQREQFGAGALEV